MTWRTFFIAAGLGLLVFVVHSISPVIHSTDSMWSVYAAKSLLTDGDLLLDEYGRQAKQRKMYGLRRKQGHLVNYFPPGTSLLAVPFVAGLEWTPAVFCRAMPGWNAEVCARSGEISRAEDLHLRLERTAAAFYVGLCAVCLYLLLRKSHDDLVAGVAVLLFGFCSSAWSMASRGLWQHGPIMLLFAFAILLLSSERWWLRGASGAVLAFAYIVRPSAALALPILGVLLLRERRSVLLYGATAALVLVPFFLLSHAFYGHFLPPYFTAGRLKLHAALPEALLANLFSPSRGLFVFMPFLIPGVVSALSRFRETGALERACLLLAACHWAAISAFPEWWGGHTYGPRYMSDVLPCLFIFIAPAVRALLFQRGMKAGILMAFCVVFSLFVHARGALSSAPFRWNISPQNIDEYPSRVWSVSDPQFLR